MKLRLIIPAARQLERVLSYIDERSAQRVRQRLHAIMQMLLHQPEAGTLMERRGMRRVLALP